MILLMQRLRSPCASSDKTPSPPILGSHSIPSASDHSDARLQDALARIPAHASLPSGIPPKKYQDCTGLAENYRWSGWPLTIAPHVLCALRAGAWVPGLPGGQVTFLASPRKANQKKATRPHRPFGLPSIFRANRAAALNSAFGLRQTQPTSPDLPGKSRRCRGGAGWCAEWVDSLYFRPFPTLSRREKCHSGL
jgi:hypothetical protein